MQKDDLPAGRTPRPRADVVTVRDLLNGFLTAKRHLLDTRELTQRSFADYIATCERIAGAFGRNRPVKDLGPDDFDSLRATIGKTWGPVALGNEINRVRIVFRYGEEAGLLESPARFGPHFKRPSRKVLRRARHEKGPRMFTQAEIKSLLKAATPTMTAMILLGINCGFGNADVGTLPIEAIDLKNGWCDFPRPKTEIMRRVPLWPETAKALKMAIESRPAARDELSEKLAFLTRLGLPWHKEGTVGDDGKVTGVDGPLSKEFAKLLVALKMKRPGLGFYALRHTFETIGGESRDQAAVDAIMGHAPKSDDMSAVYRERMTDERLKAVTDHVRAWLFPAKRKKR